MGEKQIGMDKQEYVEKILSLRGLPEDYTVRPCCEAQIMWLSFVNLN